MRKADEITLYAALRDLHGGPFNAKRCPEFADAVGVFFGIQPKRVYGLLEKWVRLGWWEYGVSVRAGWFTPEAPERIEP